MAEVGNLVVDVEFVDVREDGSPPKKTRHEETPLSPKPAARDEHVDPTMREEDSPDVSELGGIRTPTYQEMVDKSQELMLSRIEILMKNVLAGGLEKIEQSNKDLKETMVKEREEVRKDLAQQREIVGNLETDMKKMREDFDERFKLIEGEMKVAQVSGPHNAASSSSAPNTAHKSDANSTNTTQLVIGGFPRDTKQATIVEDLKRLCSVVGIPRNTFEDIFSYKRSSVGFIKFKDRDTMFSALKKAIHNQKGSEPVLTAFGGKMWIGIHKSQEERVVGSAVAVTTNALKNILRNTEHEVDPIYARGRVFINDECAAQYSNGEMEVHQGVLDKYNITKQRFEEEVAGEKEKREKKASP
jgi:hypothetical protein